MKTKTSKKIYLPTVAVFFFLIIFHYLGLTSGLENKIISSFNSILKKIEPEKIIDQNQLSLLQIKIDELSAANLTLTKENSELKDQLSFKNRSQYKILTAKVSARNLDSAKRTLIIDIGSDDGVRNGNPVTYGNGVLIGKIIKTDPQQSFVMILNDNQSKVSATILNKDKSIGVIEGGFGISIKMTFIPRNENVLVGDQIVTAGSENNIPSGLLIGKVVAIENEAYQPFQEAVVTPPVDYEKVETVGVITE